MENKTFNYTYSAKEQEEIKNIRKKYMAPEEDKIAQLRKLDSQPTQKAQALSLAIGVVGTLILGTGMSIVMTSPAGMSLAASFIVGIPIGLLGMVMIVLALPVYRQVLKKERQRVAPEIIRLSDELLK